MSPERITGEDKYSPKRIVFYQDSVDTLEKNGIPYGIMGGWAILLYTKGGRKHTNDLDLAVPEAYVEQTLHTLSGPGRRIEFKHRDWLNQVWTEDHDNPDAEECSIDIIHASSNGLVKVKQWWIDRGVTGDFLVEQHHFVAPEAVALSKVILGFRRAHDMIDAVQVTYGSNSFRPFDWQLLIDNLGPDRADWRLAYSLAVLTEMLYGKAIDEKILPKDIKSQLHSWFTDNPIASPVRGNYFAYDYDTDHGTEHEEAWKSGAVAISLSPEQAFSEVLEDVNNWHIWDARGRSRLVQAARKIVGQGENFDWNRLIEELGDNWRLALVAMLSTEILFGEKGSATISPEIRKSLSERFLYSTPDEALGAKLFPDRSWHTI